MNTVGLFFSLMSIVGWSAYPTLVSKIGGKPTQAIYGVTLCTVLIATVLSVVMKLTPPAGINFWLAFFSGIGWAFGNILTIKAFGLKSSDGEELGSAKAMPITTALQITANVLWGVIMLGNWPSMQSRLIGAVCVIAVLVGAYLTTYQEHAEPGNSALLKKGVGLLLIAQLGYSTYSLLPQYAMETDGLHMFFPQAVGMFCFGVGLGYWELTKGRNVFASKTSYKQMLSGAAFALGALGYIVASQANMLGLATSFVLSQVSIVGATLSGIVVMKLHKTRKEWMFILLGLAMIVSAAAVTAFL